MAEQEVLEARSPDGETREEADLLATTDGQKWARAFLQAFGYRLNEIDEGLMISWFANAIETGRTAGEAHASSPSAQAALYAALAAAQAEMPAVDKDSVNPHFRSKFTSLDHLIALTRPVLNKHGLAIVQLPIRDDDGMPVLRTTITHSAGASITGDCPLLPGKNDMQGLGGAVTYARRYAWASACGIASESDDDGESIAERPQERRSDAADASEAGSQHDKDQKAAHAIKRKLIEAGLTQEQFEAGLVADFGTGHINELTAEQCHTLVAKLREAEKAIAKEKS